MTSASSSRSLGVHCVWSVVGWLIVYQDGNYLYPGQYSQTIYRLQIRWYHLLGGNILMARPSTFLESRSWRGHDYGKFIYQSLWKTNSIIIYFQVGFAFNKLEEGYESAIKDYYKKQIAQLNNLITLLLGKLKKGDRQNIMTICTIDVHSRDVVGRIITRLL